MGEFRILLRNQEWFCEGTVAVQVRQIGTGMYTVFTT